MQRSGAPDALIGTVVDSKYEVHALIGEGGMGAVYAVRHMLLDKEMALKTFSNAQLAAETWQRFQREAQAIARLRHANIIQVFDFGIGLHNYPFYTMELLKGESFVRTFVEKWQIEHRRVRAHF